MSVQKAPVAILDANLVIALCALSQFLRFGLPPYCYYTFSTG